MGLPETVAAVGLQPAHPGLAAGAALDHALEGLEGVEVVAVDAAVTDAHRLLDPGAYRHVDGGGAPGHGQGGAGHEREVELPGQVVHPSRPLPLPRQVLVVEDGGGLPRGAEDVDDLHEELVARVEVLVLLVRLVLAVLADQEDAVDGQVVRAQGQGLGDGRAQLHLREALDAILGEVALGALVDVEGDDIHLGAVMAAVPAIPLEEAVDDVLSVGVLVVRGDDGGDTWAPVHRPGAFRSVCIPAAGAAGLTFSSTLSSFRSEQRPLSAEPPD